MCKCRPSVSDENLRKPWGEPGAFSIRCKPHWLTVKIICGSIYCFLWHLSSFISSRRSKRKRLRTCGFVWSPWQRECKLPGRFMGSPGEPAWEMVYVSFQGKKTDDQVKKKTKSIWEVGWWRHLVDQIFCIKLDNF